jgi:hypothetical protein
VIDNVVGGINVELNKRKILNDKEIEKIKINKREKKCMNIIIGIIEGLDWENNKKSKIKERVKYFEDEKNLEMEKMGIIYSRLVEKVGRKKMKDMNMMDREKMYFGKDKMKKDKVNLLKKLIIKLNDVKKINRLVEIFKKLEKILNLTKVDENELVKKMCKK